MYRFASTCVFLRDENQIVVANRKNGKWIKISVEIMEILKMLCRAGDEEVIEYEDVSDKNYMESLVKKCCKIGILLTREEKEEKQSSLASVEMTHRCNLQCIHCCIEAECSMAEEDLTTEEMKKYWTN